MSCSSPSPFSSTLSMSNWTSIFDLFPTMVSADASSFDEMLPPPSSSSKSNASFAVMSSDMPDVAPAAFFNLKLANKRFLSSSSASFSRFLSARLWLHCSRSPSSRDRQPIARAASSGVPCFLEESSRMSA